MVKLIKEFTLSGNEDRVFDLILNKTPAFLNEEEDGYHILEEIQEPFRFYRKARIEKKSFLEEYPSFIRDKLPPKLLETSTKLLEESVFDLKEKKIKWKIESELDDIYILHGTTRFLRLDENKCKVIVLFYMELFHLEHYFPNTLTRNLVTPFIESKIPEYFIDNLKKVYRQILNENSPSK